MISINLSLANTHRSKLSLSDYRSALNCSTSLTKITKVHWPTMWSSRVKLRSFDEHRRTRETTCNSLLSGYEHDKISRNTSQTNESWLRNWHNRLFGLCKRNLSVHLCHNYPENVNYFSHNSILCNVIPRSMTVFSRADSQNVTCSEWRENRWLRKLLENGQRDYTRTSRESLSRLITF